MIFTPIIKTKKSSEYNAMKALTSKLQTYECVMPYIECIKNINEKGVAKYIDLFKNKCIFVEPLNEDLDNIVLNIQSYSNNIIFVYRVKSDTKAQNIIDFLDKAKKENRQIGIKIDDADDRFLSLISALNNTDYLFVELNGTSYTSSAFLEDLHSQELKCKIIIHSNERYQYLRGEDFKDLSFNEKDNFNTSVIDSIKKGIFHYDGFGSRCSAKNDNTEEVKIAKEVYGVFLIYDYSHNNFYSVQSDKKEHIGKVYSQVKNKVIKNRTMLDIMFFVKTPISSRVLDEYLNQPKISCQKFIAVSIIRYIEEIIRNLF